MDLNTSIDKKYIYKYLCTSQHPKGIIYISHGMAEHIGRYKWIVNKLINDGYHVFAIDHRGHGNRIINNELGFFFDVNGWELVVNDLCEFIKSSRKDYPNLNTYLLAHSMGSWIALSAMQKGLNINGLILSGSSKQIKPLLIIQKFIVNFNVLLYGKRGISKFIDEISLGQYNKKFKPNRTKKDWISSDNDNVDDYVEDPLCGFMVTNGLWRDLINGLLDVFKKNKYKRTKINTPILLISGSLDPVGENGKGVKRLELFLRSIYTNVSSILVDDARHEVFSETSKESSYNKLLKFIGNI